AVTVYEAFHTAGGVMMYGIPEFRLPKRVVKKEVDTLLKQGVTIEMNAVIGRLYSIEELFHEEGYEAVFLGTGAGLPRFMNIPGESRVGVYSANEFLTRINLMKAYNEKYDTPLKKLGKVAVVGGGNVAMDAARSAKRLGAEEVYIVYRRSEAELPARAEEAHHAKEEGIIFKFLTSPVEIHGDEKGIVRAIECEEMELGEPDESGRRRPKPKANSNFEIPVDTVIMAIGTTPNPLVTSTTPGLDTDKRGCIVADENGKTSHLAVYAGGDAVTGAATIILAMGAGRKAAHAIDEYIQKKGKN
ncbi:MAG TPA: dihydropyrimidine dehydrogenase, partial [Ruminococcaceae bacterium]|nr:dihydropyrimidine dehydrogenase [Oscillospiraceae bacterium]